MRQYNKGRPAEAQQPSELCHAFFEFAYENLVEPIAEGEPNEDNMYLASEAPPGPEDFGDSELRGCRECKVLLIRDCPSPHDSRGAAVAMHWGLEPDHSAERQNC